MKKIVTVPLIIILIGIVVGFIIYRTDQARKSDSASSGQTVPIRIRYGFTISNQTHNLVENAEFYAFAPVKQTSAQKCKAIEASHPFEIIERPFGNQVLLFRLEKMPPFGSRIITITADVELLETPQKQSLPEKTSFLLPEPHIPSDHPEIIKTAESLKSDDGVRTARHTCQWVAEHMTYERSTGSPKGALFALTRQKGDCTEYADLFTALCRASGIPARSAGGYVCPQNAVLKPSEYHNWAEFYHKGTWHIADPQRNQFLQGNTEYIATRIIHAAKDKSVLDFNKFRISNPALSVKMN